MISWFTRDVKAAEQFHKNLQQLLKHGRCVLKLRQTDIAYVVSVILREIDEEERKALGGMHE